MPSVALAGNGSRRTKLTKRLKAENRPCWICTLPIDPTAKGEDAFNCDELHPRAFGGSPYEYTNVDATHACCNTWRRVKSVAFVELVRTQTLQTYGMWHTPSEFVKHARVIEREIKAGCTPKPRPRTTTQW